MERPFERGVTRRDFLIGASAVGGAAVLTNSVVGELVKSANPEIPGIKDKISEYTIPWDARPWVWVNLAIASQYINGTVINPGQEISTIDLMRIRQMDSVSRVNTDPRIGYIAAQMSNPTELDGWGYGLCLGSTALFRAALTSPLEITERHTHYDIYPAYFEELAVGTEAAIFNPDPGDTIPTVDLKFRNPTDKPLTLNFRIFDHTGRRLHSPQNEIPDTVYKATYLDQLIKIFERRLSLLTGYEIPQQYVPQYVFGNKRIFVQAGVSGEKIPYHVNIDRVNRVYNPNTGSQYGFRRQLTLQDKVIKEDFLSEYRNLYDTP